MKTEELNNILNMRAQNLSYDKIAELTGYCSQTVYRILKKHRIELSIRKSSVMEHALRNFEAFENQRNLGSIKHYSRLVQEFNSRPLAGISSDRLFRMINFADKQLHQLARSYEKEMDSSDRDFDEEIDLDLKIHGLNSSLQATDAPSQQNPTCGEVQGQGNGRNESQSRPQQQAAPEPSSLISVSFVDQAQNKIKDTRAQAPIPSPKTESVSNPPVKTSPPITAKPSIPVAPKSPVASDQPELTADDLELLKQIPNKRIPFKRPAVTTPILELVKAHQSSSKSTLDASLSPVVKLVINPPLLKEKVA